jgi:hypothetical protein
MHHIEERYIRPSRVVGWEPNLHPVKGTTSYWTNVVKKRFTYRGHHKNVGKFCIWRNGVYIGKERTGGKYRSHIHLVFKTRMECMQVTLLLFKKKSKINYKSESDLFLFFYSGDGASLKQRETHILKQELKINK